MVLQEQGLATCLLEGWGVQALRDKTTTGYILWFVLMKLSSQASSFRTYSWLRRENAGWDGIASQISCREINIFQQYQHLMQSFLHV